jgi:hypothetical protein
MVKTEGRKAVGRRKGARVAHEPNLATILMVERAIRDAKAYPTKRQLWNSLPKGVQYQTFNRIIDYLLSSNKIIMNDREIVWVFADNPRLKRMLSTGIRVR